MEIRLIDLEKDYELLASWWTAREHYVILKDMLSPFGMIAYKEEKPIAAVWLYPSLGSPWAMIRFPIANPDSSKDERQEALDLVIRSLHDLARDMKCKYVLCSTNHKGFIPKLEALGYFEDASDCKHLMGVL